MIELTLFLILLILKATVELGGLLGLVILLLGLIHGSFWYAIPPRYDYESPLPALLVSVAMAVALAIASWFHPVFWLTFIGPIIGLPIGRREARRERAETALRERLDENWNRACREVEAERRALATAQ
jgi:hypothetical protein